MRRIIVLDSFPLSCVGKSSGTPPSVTDKCRQWISECIASGNSIRVPAIVYYETLRELERLNANAQIARLKTFCFAVPGRFLPLETVDLEEAARLWAQARNIGRPTAAPTELDGDVLIAAQALNMGSRILDFVVATVNVRHLSQFVPADEWTNIEP